MKTIKEIRALTGLSQVKFSEQYGIPRRTIESWESGERKCPPYVTELLARAVREDFETDTYIEDEMIVETVEQIYASEGLNGVLKLLDRFIAYAGVDKAIEIMEDYRNEGCQN